MPQLLVSDTSILIDLERGNLLQATFKLPRPLAVPDVLYESELRATNGELLVGLGLQVLTLDGAGAALAQTYAGRGRGISTPDAFAVALAKTGGHILASGDRALKELAAEETVECHGLFWILDQLLEAEVLSSKALRTGLERIASHPRCRLPKDLIEVYTTKFGA